MKDKSLWDSIVNGFNSVFVKPFQQLGQQAEQVGVIVNYKVIQPLTTIGSELFTDVVSWPPKNSTENGDAFRDVFNNNSPTKYHSLGFLATTQRYMYDERGKVNDYDYQYITAHIFTPIFLLNGAFYDNMKIYVNAEIDIDTARKHAELYATIFGQFPIVLLESIREVFVHKSGSNTYYASKVEENPDKPNFWRGDITIYADQAEKDFNGGDGTLQEILFHETTHTGIDKYCIGYSSWISAQNMDPKWISNYAKNNPNREDVAESFLVYYALKYRDYKLSDVTKGIIRDAIPNRIAFFDNLIKNNNLDMNV